MIAACRNSISSHNTSTAPIPTTAKISSSAGSSCGS